MTPTHPLERRPQPCSFSHALPLAHLAVLTAARRAVAMRREVHGADRMIATARSTAPPYASQVTRKRFDLARYKKPSRLARFSPSSPSLARSTSSSKPKDDQDGLLLHRKLDLHLRIQLRLQEVISLSAPSSSSYSLDWTSPLPSPPASPSDLLHDSSASLQRLIRVSATSL
ncbi:hypothetical protein OF846_000542 [Rhodotorula toruloides]|nr:hypothetical protein OF846_000542 [Rhodotorula toruloides]